MGQITKLFKNTPLLISFMFFLLPSVIVAIVITLSFAPELGDFANQIKYNPTNGTTLSQKDKVYYYLFEISSKVLWVMPIVVAVTIVPYIFYQLKIKKPLQLLLDSAEKIANEDLDFIIDFESLDEMGKLCTAFEKMRSTLEKNNKESWRMLEERKKLNAIFAHDLGTPLTVLHGYSDFLMKYIPDEKISKEKLMKTVETMNHHILRIENYVQHMNDIQRFEDIEIKYKTVSFLLLSDKLQETAHMMKTKNMIDFKVMGNDLMIELDEYLVYQVFENIISNAMEYTTKTILITCEMKESHFIFRVSDDGIGFSTEDLPYITQPFYRSEKDFNKQHFGLGLYTSKKICEKHGGKLLVDNNEKGGACITASFKLKC